jgi:RNA polymerase sigma-70 factor (ECF subfamily)
MHTTTITTTITTTSPLSAVQVVPTMAGTTDLTLRERTFDDLYRREFPGLVAVATALSGYDGEDLVQDAMVKALVNWERVSRLERPGGWCHRVLVNLCRSRWRRRRTEARFLGRLRREEPCTPGPSVEALAFWAAVRTLPERPRLAVTLYYAGDRPVAEVASILDVPEGTVRSDLTRARAALSRELDI